jgi:ParB family chromosome partitioning protein
MVEKRPALGRGLSALIPPAPPAQPATPTPSLARPVGPPHELDIDLLTPNPRQPRTYIEEQALEELAQ